MLTRNRINISDIIVWFKLNMKLNIGHCLESADKIQMWVETDFSCLSLWAIIIASFVY